MLAADFGPLADFSFQPNAPSLIKVWSQGYQLIESLNRLEPRTEDPVWSGRLRLVRAYIYLQLMTYFGNIPLAQDVTSGNLTNDDPDAVYNFVKQELLVIEEVIPEDGGPVYGSKATVQALLVRVGLLRKDYNIAATYSNRLISSGNHLLSPVEDRFAVLSPEHIWNMRVIPDDIGAFFFNRPAFPILRYSEVLLAGAEAKLALGDKATAARYLNQLAVRDGSERTDGELSTALLTDKLRNHWRMEMPREGTTFANFVRWGVASDSLGHRGFQSHQTALPIPQAVIDNNPQLRQNGGY